MSDPFIGEIRAFANTFVPNGWLPCSGQTLAVSQYQALLAVIGFSYGGDGKTNFGLPNLNGKAAIGPGQAPGGANVYQYAKSYGQEGVVLTPSTMPAHKHQLQKKNTNATPPSAAKTSGPSATSNLGGLSNDLGTVSYKSGVANGAQATTPLSPVSMGTTGGGAPHENRQPFVAMYHAIAWQGVFPVKP